MTTNNKTPREAIAKFTQRDARIRLAQVIYPDGFIDSSREYTVDRVIKYLWEKASDPEIVEAIAKFGVEDWDRYVPDGPLQDGLRQRAKGEIAELLTLLIGLPLSK